MATLYISEYSEAAFGQVARGLPIAAEPPLAEQTVAIGAEADSAAFNAKTRVIRTPAVHIKIFANSGAQLGDPSSPGANTGFIRLPDVLAKIAFEIAQGREPIVSTLFGANDNTVMTSIGTAAYFSRLSQYWAACRSAGAKIVAGTILPQDAVAGFEANRQAVNTLIRANPSLYDALADLGADTDIGLTGVAQPGTYYYDTTHLNFAGHTIAAAIWKAAIDPLRITPV